MSQSAYRRVCGAATPKPPVAIERVTPHGRPAAARGVQPGLRGLDGETPSCAGLCGGRTRSSFDHDVHQPLLDVHDVLDRLPFDPFHDLRIRLRRIDDLSLVPIGGDCYLASELPIDLYRDRQDCLPEQRLFVAWPALPCQEHLAASLRPELLRNVVP